MSTFNNITQQKSLIKSSSIHVIYDQDHHTLVCSTVGIVIKYEEFVDAFEQIGELVKLYGVSKLIFDKRSLKFFDQASMTWYHVHWKAAMLQHGLDTYRKILPQNDLFKQSVEIGKGKIVRENPDFDFEKFDIQYFDTIDAALTN